MSSPLTISFSHSPASIRISIGILEFLNYPKYLRFLINKEKGQLLVQACSKEEKRAIKINYYAKHTLSNGVYACSLLMSTVLFKECSWDINKTYRTKGIPIKSKNIIICNLNECEDVSREPYCYERRNHFEGYGVSVDFTEFEEINVPNGIDYEKTVKDLRNKMILTQIEFAEMMSVSFATINRWENGVSEPTKLIKKRVVGLCEKYSVVLSYKNSEN